MAAVAFDVCSSGVRVTVVVLHSVTIVAVGIGLLLESWLNTWCLVADWEARWVLSVIVSCLNNLGRVMLMVSFTMVTSAATNDCATNNEDNESKDEASDYCTSSSSNHCS